MKYGVMFVLILVLLVGCTQVVPQDIEPVKITPSEEIIENVPKPEVVIVPEPVEVEEKEEVISPPIVKEKEEPITPEEPILTKFYNDTKWMRIDMQDVVTNEIFTINSLKGQMLFVEIYSKSCNSCSEQKVKLQDFISENNDTIRHISVNTDINADREELLESIERYDYDWTFVLSSKELKNSIVDQFGQKAIRYQLTPLILVCKDQSAYLFEGSLKGKTQLSQALEKCS